MSLDPDKEKSGNSVTIEPSRWAQLPAFSLKDEEVSRRNSEVIAITLAQQSIDRHLGISKADVDESFSEAELEQIATTLDFLGNLGGGQLLSPCKTFDKPWKIGRFDIYGEQGRGGFGIVLRAFDPVLQREVALKIPRPERLLAGQLAEDFVREAQVTAKLDHPGIVRVYETRRLGPVWYIASAFCDGPTLAEWLAHQQSEVRPKHAAKLVADIAESLHYAHTRGVLHLDIKPENVLLSISDEAGALPRPMITDFGLAGLSGDTAVERRGRIAGTLAYMAPEQRAGDAQRISVASDVFALGAMLHDLIAGNDSVKPLASGETISAVADPPLRAPLRGVPRDLAAICQKCLQENPDDRYDSARDLGNDLRRYLRGEIVLACAPRPFERVFRWACRRPAVAALCALLGLVITLSGFTTGYLWRRAEANLTKLRAEHFALTQTEDRMRSALLNLTWLSQENRLQHGHPRGDIDDQLRLLQLFYRDLRDWSATSSGGPVVDAALRAASESIALTDGMTPLSSSRANDEFFAGLHAWQDVIAQDPTEQQWRRALALHILTYAARYHPPHWIWWREPPSDMPAIDSSTTDLFEECYAQLLLQYGSKSGAMGGDPERACQMLQAALTLLQDRRTLPDPDATRLRATLTAFNELSTAYTRRGDPKRAREALGKAKRLAIHAPDPANSPPLLALALAETWNLSARTNHDASVNCSDVVEAYDRAAGYYRRVLEESPNKAAVRSVLADIYRRTAEVYARKADNAIAVGRYQAGLLILDEGLSLTPGHRDFTRRRATLAWSLAESLMALRDLAGAEKNLQVAVRDFKNIGLRKQDSVSVWLECVRSWQDLGQVYSQLGLKDEAIQAYQESLKVLEPAKTRRGNNAHCAQYAETGRNSLAKLLSP